VNTEPEFDPALEAELRKTAPAPMDERLLDRLAHAASAAPFTPVAQPHTMRFGWKFWLMPGMAVTALTMILTLKPGPQLSTQTPHNPAAPSAEAAAMDAATDEKPIDLFPARRYNEVASAYDGGIVHLSGQQPFRHVRMRRVDTFTWEDPNGPTRVEFTVPRDEHLLIPAEIH